MQGNAEREAHRAMIKPRAVGKVDLYWDDALLGAFPSIADAQAWIDNKYPQAEWIDDITADIVLDVQLNDGT